MKKKILSFILGILLIGFNGFAADGDLFVNGKVGIGTTTPSRNLHVNSSGDTFIASDAPLANHAVLELKSAGTETGAIYRPAGTTDMRLYVSGIGDAITILNSNGKVGIGNTNPTYLLTMEASGGGYYNQSTHTWVNGSSGRWKSNITTITGALDTVLKLNGVSFKWKKRTDIFEDNIDGTQRYISSSWEDDPNGRNDIGLIGEDVLKVLPEVVDIDQKDLSFVAGVAYSKIVPLLIEAIKEQQKAIEELRAELEKMKVQ